VDRRRFRRLVEQALEGLPPVFRERLENVAVIIEDLPEPDLLRDLGMDEDDLLFGLYEGLPLTEWGRDDVLRIPDRIRIFQRPIEKVRASDKEIIAEVRSTVLHEVGHHFGLSDEELERYEREG
jgi:predicted Zn-dependent protease with MMP-like domain